MSPRASAPARAADARGDMRASAARAGALLAAAALVLHQLRYAIGLGGHPGHDAGAHGHGYLSTATSAVAALAVIALVSVVWRLAAGRAGAGRTPLARLWLACASLLVALHLGQESIEALATAGSAGLASLGAPGGWAVVPLAGLLGGLVALGLRGTAEGLPPVCPRPIGSPPRAPRVPITVAFPPRRGHQAPRSTRGARGPPLPSA